MWAWDLVEGAGCSRSAVLLSCARAGCLRCDVYSFLGEVGAFFRAGYPGRPAVDNSASPTCEALVSYCRSVVSRRFRGFWCE